MTAALGESRHRPVGAIMWTFSADAVSKACLFGANLGAILLLPPAVFGQFIAFQAAGVLAVPLWDLGLSSLSAREIAAGRLAPDRCSMTSFWTGQRGMAINGAGFLGAVTAGRQCEAGATDTFVPKVGYYDLRPLAKLGGALCGRQPDRVIDLGEIGAIVRLIGCAGEIGWDDESRTFCRDMSGRLVGLRRHPESQQAGSSTTGHEGRSSGRLSNGVWRGLSLTR
jgi:hypothetical protein